MTVLHYNILKKQKAKELKSLFYKLNTLSLKLTEQKIILEKKILNEFNFTDDYKNEFKSIRDGIDSRIDDINFIMRNIEMMLKNPNDFKLTNMIELKSGKLRKRTFNLEK